MSENENAFEGPFTVKVNGETVLQGIRTQDRALEQVTRLHEKHAPVSEWRLSTGRAD